MNTQASKPSADFVTLAAHLANGGGMDPVDVIGGCPHVTDHEQATLDQMDATLAADRARVIAGPPVVPVSHMVATISAMFEERASIVRAIFIALLAGEHVLMIGPPGTAKSQMFRTIVASLRGTYFETLLTLFSTPEDVFGPIKMSGLANDKFSRAFQNYAPGAQYVLLDEVYKSNAAVLNSLLAMMNERVYHDDGKACAVPLASLFGASNELPAEGQGLEALDDRFMIRIVTDSIQDRGARKRMLQRAAKKIRPSVTTCVDMEAEQAKARAVDFTDATMEAYLDLQESAKRAGFKFSDRRWAQAIGIVQAAAHLDGQTATTPDDLECLEHVLWTRPDERPAMAKIIQETINPAGAKAVAELDAAKDLMRRLPDASQLANGPYMQAIGQAVQDIGTIQKRLKAMQSATPGKKVSAALVEVAAMAQTVGKLALKAAGVDV